LYPVGSPSRPSGASLPEPPDGWEGVAAAYSER